MQIVELREFLKDLKMASAKTKGIINDASGHKNLLAKKSVKPLLAEMQARGVDALICKDVGWKLHQNGDFVAPLSRNKRSGNIQTLQNPGSIFQHMNRLANPFYSAPNGVDKNYYQDKRRQAFQKIREGLDMLEDLMRRK